MWGFQRQGRSPPPAPCIGSHSRGCRNDNGDALVEFATNHNRLMSNTCFQHVARHLTSREGRYQARGSDHSVPVYNQIDFILVKSIHRKFMTECRTYSGTQVASDLRLLHLIPNLLIHLHYANVNRKPTMRVNTDRLV